MFLTACPTRSATPARDRVSVGALGHGGRDEVR